MNESIDWAVEQLIGEGIIDEEYNPDEDDLVYDLTDKGLDKGKELIQEDEKAQLFCFSIVWNEQVDESMTQDEMLSLLVEIALEFKKSFKVNLMRTIFDNKEDFGDVLIIKKEPPEEFLQNFDPNR